MEVPPKKAWWCLRRLLLARGPPVTTNRLPCAQGLQGSGALGTDLELGFRWAGDDDHPFADVRALCWGNLQSQGRKTCCELRPPSPPLSSQWTAHTPARGHRASSSLCLTPAASTLGLRKSRP